MSTNAFRANLSDVTGQVVLGPLSDPQHDHARQLRERNAEQEQTELLGLQSGSIESVSGRMGSEGHARTIKQQAERARATAKASTDTALWVAMLQQGSLDSYIAEHIFSGMDDAEIGELVAKIEAETGTSFEEYAEMVLGGLPERNPHESDVDYQRRILGAIAEEVLQDGEIKPEYADDPVARFIREHEFRKEVVAAVHNSDARIEQGEDADVVRSDAKVKINASVSAADAYGEHSKTEALRVDGRDGHDVFRDDKFSSNSAVENSGSFLNGFTPALSAASEDMKEQFAGASEPDTKAPTTETNLDIEIKPV